MRVISKFQDYYDHCGYVDRSVCFIRDEYDDEIKMQLPDPHISDVGLIGFCGKLYPYLHKRLSIDSYTPDKDFYFYSAEEYFDSYFFKNAPKYRYFGENRENVTNFFISWTKVDDNPFFSTNSAIFALRNWKWRSWDGLNRDVELIINPILKDYQFQKVVGGQQAFQEIQMYITNQLVERKDPDVIDDKYRLAGRGFDKYSFRHPTKLKDLK